MDKTHYIAAFTQTDRWNRSRTVCGIFIGPKDFSTEPTCPACQAWIKDDDEGFLTVQGLTDTDFPPAPPARVFGDFDPTRDLPEKGKR